MKDTSNYKRNQSASRSESYIKYTSIFSPKGPLLNYTTFKRTLIIAILSTLEIPPEFAAFMNQKGRNPLRTITPTSLACLAL
jgi:hypothetical protein